MNHRVREAILQLVTGKGKPTLAAKYLREQADYPDQFASLQSAASNDATLGFLAGNLFAKSWNDVWSVPKLPAIKSPRRAISWQTAVLNLHSRTLDHHARRRSVLESAVLRGEFDTANTELANHMREFGPSLWAAGWALVLAEETGGASARQAIRDELAKNGSHNFGFIIRLLSLSADKSLTEERYRSLVKPAVAVDDAQPFLELILLSDISTQWDCALVLRFVEFLPLIDRYEIFLRLVTFGIGSAHGDSPPLERAVERLTLEDENLKYLQECLTTKPLQLQKPTELIRAWDAYVVGNYEACVLASRACMDEDPTILSGYELCVKAAMYLNRPAPKLSATPMGELESLLRHVFEKSPQAEESLNSLLRLATRLRIPSLTFPLRGLHAQHALPISEQKWQRVAAYAIKTHGPRNFDYGFTPQFALQYLIKLHERYSNSVAIEFFLAVATNRGWTGSGNKPVPIARILFFEGFAAARQGNYTVAADRLEQFITLHGAAEIHPLSPFAIEESRRLLIDVYRHKEDVLTMQSMLIAAFLERPQSLRRLPVSEAFVAATEFRGQAGEHPQYAILAYLSGADPHKIYLCLKRYLRSLHVTKPSDLTGMVLPTDPEIMGILFLRVCTPEVLDSISDLDTEQKVDAERLKILDWVKRNVDGMAHTAQDEMLQVTQNAQLREALAKLEEAKVVLNVSALRAAEKDRFDEVFQKFMAQRELALFRTQNDIMSAILKKDGPRVTFVPNASVHAESAFGAAIREIRDAFLFSPYYGLEACLSGGIRHGIIVHHIRKPLLENKIAVVDPMETEKTWATKLGISENSPVLKASVDSMLRLTQRVDGIAEEVKEQWIQSKTEQKNPQGLFDYSFSDDELKAFQRTFDREWNAVDAFLDQVFDLLLKRTRDSLKAVRGKIRNDLLQRLTYAIDDGIREVSALDNDVQLLPLRNALTACRQELETVCMQLVRWFQESETSLMGDTDFDLVGRTAVGMVERLNPHFRGRFTIQINDTFRVRGRHFKALVFVLFYLLDNAVRHSGLPASQFRASVRIGTDNGKLRMCVSSRMMSESAANEAAEKIRVGVSKLKKELDPERVIREGGSGLAKIIATVIYEFHQTNPNIEVSVEGAELAVEAVTTMGGLVAA